MYNSFIWLAQYFKPRHSVVDNTTFRLHYRTTFALLIGCTILVSMNQLIGSPIMCIAEGITAGIMNTYCWIHGTFTIPSQLSGVVGKHVPHPGVAPITYNSLSEEQGHLGFTEDGDVIRHAWYQWVVFVLFLQAIMFYTPHYMWKIFEGGKLGMLIGGLDSKTLLPTDRSAAIKPVVTYLSRTTGKHDLYAFKHLFCEILNLANVLFQIYFMDVFFNGQFSKYGFQVLNVVDEPLEQRVDPMSRVFPKVTKCTFHNYGPSGTIEKRDGLCVLALNIINEKIYVFLWFWFVALACWTALYTLTRLFTVASQQCRITMLWRNVRSVNQEDIRSIVSDGGYGDWLILMQMSRHVDPASMHQILQSLAERKAMRTKGVDYEASASESGSSNATET